MSKIVVIGANHAGTAAINTILDNYSDNEVIVFDRNSNISYLGCGTALWIGGQIDGPEGLFYSSKEKMEEKGATVYMETDIDRIDFQKKMVYAVDKQGKKIEQEYDKLILATGSLPIEPAIEGIHLGNVQSVKLFQDGQHAIERLEKDEIQDVAIIGAGYIGVELAEAVRRHGRNATLYEVASTCLCNYYDSWFTDDMDHVLRENGVNLSYNEKVLALKGDDKNNVQAIVTDKGESPAQMVILAIGFRPNTALGKDDIALFGNGAYKVNRRQETSLKDVYAIGDCATVYDNARQAEAYIALATNAVRSGIVAGHNACGTDIESEGVQGSNGISIFGYNMVSTGLNLEAARRAGFTPLYSDYEDLQRPAFMRENAEVKIRLVYDEKTRRLLGAQMASREDISMGIHMFSLAIEEGVTIDKLKLLDIFFLPHFNQPYNYITMAALSAK